MMLKYISVLLLLVFPISALSSDLLDVYKKTLAFDPSLKQAEATRLSALQASPQALAKLFPTINLQANYNYNNQNTNYENDIYADAINEYNAYGAGISLRQSLVNLSNFNRVKQADITIASAEIQFANFYQDLLYKTVLAYLEFLAANDSLIQYMEEKDLVATFLAKVIESHKAGEIAVVDVHDVQARHDAVISNISFASARVNAVRETLRAITGEYFVTLSALRKDSPYLVPEPSDPEWWVKQALDNNFTLLGSQLAVQASKLDLKYQKLVNFPTVDLVGNYNLYNNSDLSTIGGETTGSSVGIEFNWNLYQGGLNSSYIKQSRFALTQIEMNYSLKQKEIEQQIRSAYYLIYSEMSRINDLHRAIISHQQALAANQVAYDLKTRTIRDLLISIEQISVIKRGYSQSRYNYLIQYITLHKVAGLLNSAFISKINKLLGG